MELVFDQVYVKDGEVKAYAPSIAGFYGAYTGQKPGIFSVSYDVRESESGGLTPSAILSNLQRNLDSNRVPQATAVQQVLLYA